MDRNLRIRMLLEAGDRVTRPLKDIAAGSSRAAQALKATRDRLKQLERAQTDIAGFRSLKLGLRSTEGEMTEAQARVAALARQMAAAENPTKKLATEFARAKRESAALKNEHTAQSARLQELRTRLSAAGISTRDLVGGERDLRTAIERTNTELAEQERRLRTAADRSRRFGAARQRFGEVSGAATGVAASGFSAIQVAQTTAAPLFAASRASMSLEEGMAGVAKVTGLAGPRLAAMREDLIGLSTKIPMTAVELANIAAAAGAAGIGMDKFGRPLPTQAQDLIAFSDAAARMGIAFDMTAEDAGGTMAKWRQAFQMTQPEVEALGDRINALTNKFGGKAAAVSDIVGRIGPLGKIAGVTAPQIAAMGSTLNSIGVESEIAATGIKNTLLALSTGGAATAQQSAAFKALGLDAQSVAKAMQKNAGPTIIDVFERIAKATPDRQASLLKNLFGSESIGAIAPLLTNLDGLRQRFGLVGDQSQYAGSMTNEFLSRINTTTGATDLAANGLQAINLTLGQALLPTIKAAAQWVSAFSGRVRAWAQANPALAKAVMFLAGGLAVLFGIFGVGAIAIAAIMGPIAILEAGLVALGVAGGIASIGLLPIIGTVAAIVAGIALLAGAVYLIYNNWDKITGFFSGIWEQVKTAFDGGLWGVLALLVNWGGQLLSALWGGITAAFNWVVANFPAIAAGLKTVMWNVLWNGLLLLPRLFIQFGINTLKGFVQGMMSALGWVKDAIYNVGASVIGWFREKLDIHSPSRVFASLGGHMMDGLALGLDRGKSAPLARISRLTAQMTAAMAAGAAVPAMAADMQIGRMQALSHQVSSAVGVGARRNAAPPGAAARGSPPVGDRYEITINAAPGMDEAKLVALLKRELAAIERTKQSNRNASFADTPDWEDHG